MMSNLYERNLLHPLHHGYSVKPIGSSGAIPLKPGELLKLGYCVNNGRCPVFAPLKKDGGRIINNRRWNVPLFFMAWYQHPYYVQERRKSKYTYRELIWGDPTGSEYDLFFTMMKFLTFFEVEGISV